MKFKKYKFMYAVLFDMDTNCLEQQYEGSTHHNSYKLIKDFMLANDFTWKQGSIYFGNDSIDAVSCVLTVQKLAKKYSWFASCVKDVRMLRIEENNDLIQALI